MLKLLLADDHDLVRGTLASYMRQEARCDVHQAASLDEAMDMCECDGPFDLIVLDFRMPGMEGLSGLQRISRICSCPVAVLSGSAPPDVAGRAMQKGAAGFLPKTLSPEEMVAAVKKMLAGHTYLPEAVEFRQHERHSIHLTPRELDVLNGVTKGKLNKEIAVDLEIQEVTVKLHVKTLSRKLGAKNRTHAAMLARDMGIV
ncbi:MAG: response regulator transcription factor [Pseudomonadota bacterium]